jgi:hypothetical protein
MCGVVMKTEYPLEVTMSLSPQDASNYIKNFLALMYRDSVKGHAMSPSLGHA